MVGVATRPSPIQSTYVFQLEAFRDAVENANSRSPEVTMQSPTWRPLTRCTDRPDFRCADRLHRVGIKRNCRAL